MMTHDIDGAAVSFPVYFLARMLDFIGARERGNALIRWLVRHTPEDTFRRVAREQMMLLRLLGQNEHQLAAEVVEATIDHLAQFHLPDGLHDPCRRKRIAAVVRFLGQQCAFLDGEGWPVNTHSVLRSLIDELELDIDPPPLPDQVRHEDLEKIGTAALETFY